MNLFVILTLLTFLVQGGHGLRGKRQAPIVIQTQTVPPPQTRVSTQQTRTTQQSGVQRTMQQSGVQRTTQQGGVQRTTQQGGVPRTTQQGGVPRTTQQNVTVQQPNTVPMQQRTSSGTQRTTQQQGRRQQSRIGFPRRNPQQRALGFPPGPSPPQGQTARGPGATVAMPCTGARPFTGALTGCEDCCQLLEVASSCLLHCARSVNKAIVVNRFVAIDQEVIQLMATASQPSVQQSPNNVPMGVNQVHQVVTNVPAPQGGVYTASFYTGQPPPVGNQPNQPPGTLPGAPPSANNQWGQRQQRTQRGGTRQQGANQWGQNTRRTQGGTRQTTNQWGQNTRTQQGGQAAPPYNNVGQGQRQPNNWGQRNTNPANNPNNQGVNTTPTPMQTRFPPNAEIIDFANQGFVDRFIYVGAMGRPSGGQRGGQRG